MAFVEGQTEQEYLESLISHMGQNRDVRIDKNVARPIAEGEGALRVLKGYEAGGACSHYVCLLDTNGDGGVLSRLLESYARIESSYHTILTMRDVYPKTGGDASRLMRSVERTIEQKASKAKCVFAIPETEAWFIADDSHFARIDSQLTSDLILQNTKYDILKGDPEKISRPAKKLKDIYNLVQKTYNKKLSNVQRTVGALDHDHMRSRNESRLYGYGSLCPLIDSFFA